MAETLQNQGQSNNESDKNRTDPKVCHDPKLDIEGIVRVFIQQQKENDNDEEVYTNNEYDMTRLDGIEYPLVVINNRNIENHDILSLKISYREFLPHIILIVRDEHQSEQKINSTQMSSIIRVCIVSKVDKVYKKILLNFRTTTVKINEIDPTIVTYYGDMYVPGFRDINTKHIYMKNVCPSQPKCGQGGHINANTWEMLHEIARLTELGFAATDKCKDVKDHLVRNVYSQRFDKYIEQQLLHCGSDEQNIFDAWVDFYGYIVMVNVPWVMNEDINPEDLEITANVGLSGTSMGTPEQQAQTVQRTLTNYPEMGMPSNMEIFKYSMDIDNNALNHGTLERIYTIEFNNNMTELSNIDIQSMHNSVDGKYIEDYNTGKNRPIPKFNFNDDKWTGLTGGYNVNQQKIIRNAYFRIKRQSILNVQLKNINLGLQRGTLVNIMIFDNDVVNKQKTMHNIDNITGEEDNIDAASIDINEDITEDDIIMDGDYYLPNFKLSGLYYIDGMTFEYARDEGRIIQTLHLIKKGILTGYENRHTLNRIPTNTNNTTNNTDNTNNE